MDDVKLKSYEILSEDRRRGLELFLKGLTIFLILYGVGLKTLLDSKDLFNARILACSGFAILFFSHMAIWKSIHFNTITHGQIERLCEDFKLPSPFNVRFLYIAVWGLMFVLSIIWVVTSGMKWSTP